MEKHNATPPGRATSAVCLSRGLNTMDIANELRPVARTRPLAGYIGGKRNLAATITARLQAIPHKTYAEPFVGMGGVFFRRTLIARAEVINDGNAEVSNLFRVLQRHYIAFLDMLKWQLSSRREFERLKATDPKTLTDLERAARFLYLQRTAFGGKVTGQNFGVSAAEHSAFDVTRLGPMLEEVHERLSGVTIEGLPYGDFITRYDRPETLFYLDPPYWGTEHVYGEGLFARADFERLAGLLKGLTGAFILSLNDTPGVRETFAGFRIEAVANVAMIGSRSGKASPMGEALISGGAAYPKDRARARKRT